jgi:hypothetical protein
LNEFHPRTWEQERAGKSKPGAGSKDGKGHLHPDSMPQFDADTAHFYSSKEEAPPQRLSCETNSEQWPATSVDFNLS